MLLIFTQEKSPRLTYIIEHIFTRVLELKYRLTDNKTTAEATKDAVINYSNIPLQKGIQIIPCGLLSEVGIHTAKPKVKYWEETPVFFETEGGDIPFDIFSATFYLLSRYEEYTTESTFDKHGRFLHTHSLAYENNFLQKPLVDIWIKRLRTVLLQKYPKLKLSTPSFFLIPTIDIDNLFAYKYRGFLRTSGATFRDALSGKFTTLMRRLRVGWGLEPDPYNNIKEVVALHKQFKILPIFFLHFGDYGAHDKYAIFPNKEWKAFGRTFQRPYTVGLHPSYKAAVDWEQLKKEKNRMEAIVGVNANICRYHFLRFRLPVSYRWLLKARIREDFSMAYADALGFRASTCFPFYFYDLLKERSSEMLVHSPCVMDVTLKNRLKLSPDKAVEKCFALIDEVKHVGGEFISIFHNESLSDFQEWEGWKDMYKQILKKVLLKPKSQNL